MTREELLKHIKRLQAEELSLLDKKNRDYSRDDDAFANFKEFGELGFLVRMSDKLMRAKHLLAGKAHFEEETIKDTLMDLANYANLLVAYLLEKK